MSRPHLVLVHQAERDPNPISFIEKLNDHQALLNSYLDTHASRNHSKKTIESDRRFLYGWFAGARVRDPDRPVGERQLFIWEAMEPVHGRQRIIKFSHDLKATGLKPSTIRGYITSLRRLFSYVLDYPYIPPGLQSIAIKYGPIEQPVLVYDYPLHVDDPEEEGFVLTGERLDQFYDFVREEYIPSNQKQLTAHRDYAIIVLAGESGLRANEISHLDATGSHRDLFYKENVIQTRYGKGFRGSGKRTRKTIFTDFAKATLKVYETDIRSQFPNARSCPALFLSESGTRLQYSSMWSSFTKIVRAARNAGLDLPPRVTLHSLRKSFATNMMEQFPNNWQVLMSMMGHRNPSTLHRYIIHSQAYFVDAVNEMVRMLGNSDDEPTR